MQSGKFSNYTNWIWRWELFFSHSIFKNILTLYSFRYRILEENGDTVRASGLCIELGNALLSVGKNGEAASFYQRAADLRSDYIGLEYVHAREKVASCQIGNGDSRNIMNQGNDYYRIIFLKTVVSNYL